MVTYKHLESVEYSVKLFDKILLFGQRLKVQLSNINQKVPATISNDQTPTSTTAPSSNNSSPQNLSSGYQKPYSRALSYDNISNIQRSHYNNQHQSQPLPMMHAPIMPPQFMQNMNNAMPLNLLQFMAQPLIQQFSDNNQRHQHQSPPNHHHHQHNSRYDSRSQRNHTTSSQPHNRYRDNSYQSSDRDRRSRSPRTNSINRRR